MRAGVVGTAFTGILPNEPDAGASVTSRDNL